MNNGHIMKICIGSVNKPVIEDIVNEEFMNTALFGRQYKQMLTLLDRYVKNKRAVDENEEAPNNIFSFIGERGSGKTSCMSSVSRLLEKGKLHNFQSYENLSHTPFATIDIIDPSYFDEKHNIVSMFVAKLFKSFTSLEQEKRIYECDYDVRSELIDAFANTQRNMQCLLEDNAEDDYDEVERLADLSKAVDLKNDIQHLVQTYLRFVKKRNGVLILSIDDIDLNIGEADTMAEQIRKYLVSPNIIILLAAKLNQLSTIKNLHYAEKYKYLIDKEYMEYDSIEEMTGQFLTKFAPHDQRVYMPSADFYLESGIEIEKDSMFGDSVKQAIPELIFKKTRYLFYNSKQTASYITPRNLRKMCQLVAMLWSMSAYDDTNGEDNKQVFRNYLFGSWVQDNLQQRDRQYVQRLLDGWKNEQLNKIALDVLHEKYSTWIGKLQSNTSSLNTNLKEEVNAIFDDLNRDFNFSIGDVMSLVNLLQVSNDTYADKCFFFILKSIYSMALYESYDMITLEQDKDGYDEFANTPTEDNNQVLLYDPFSDEHISAYHKLVGGRFFNYRLDSVLPREIIEDPLKFNSSLKVSRSDRIINYGAIKKIMVEARDSWTQYISKKKQQNAKENVELQDENDGVELLKSKVRLAEFFMLCAIRDINNQNAKDKADYYGADFRRSNSVYYNGEYNGMSWLYFDLGAFFYNITCICSCYLRFGRVGRDLLSLCKDDNEAVSLFATFRKEAQKYRKGYNKYHAWQSWSSIRNIEILFDLNQSIQSKCRNIGEANNRRCLYKYFETLANYNISTYDRDEKGSNLKINFEFVSSVRDLLNNDSLEASFDKIFSWKGIAWNENSHGVDMDALLKGRFKFRNKKNTVLKYLSFHEPYIYKNFRTYVDIAFNGYDENMTKDEIIEAGTKLNILLKKNKEQNNE